MERIRDACSEFVLKSTDEIRVSGRTMDWSADLSSSFVVVPRNQKICSSIDSCYDDSIEEGMTWKNLYGYIGINLYNTSIIADGLNEHGLSVSFLFLNKVQFPTKRCKNKKNISMVHLVPYLLGKCRNIEEIKDSLYDLNICGLHVLGLKQNQGVHIIAHDKHGHNIVLEPERGKIIQYYDENATVLTNSPFLHWHLDNLSNYCNITNMNISHDSQWPAFGNGSGMLGLPGDSTPPSRFIRMAVLRRYSPICEDANEAVQQAFHIINRITFVNGEVNNSINGETSSDYTQWEVVRDHINKMYYFRSNQNQSIRAIDLKEIDFSGNTLYTPLPITEGKLYEDLTSSLVTLHRCL